MTRPGSPTQRDSRVLVLSQRNLHRPLFHALNYQFEDLLLSLDDVQVLAPLGHRHPDASSLGRRLLNGGLRRTGRPRHSPPGNRPSMQAMPVRSEHDLFFMFVNDAYQLSYLNRLDGWRDRCRRAVCLLMEVWTPGVARDADYYAMLRQFDAVYIFTPAASPALVSLGAPEPRFLPTGVDALQSRPGLRAPDRVVDVYTYGRTSPVVHDQLLRQVEDANLTYLYDTTVEAVVTDHVAHRALLTSIMKRSRYFLAHRINDSPERQERTGGEEALSTRYFEATAGGAVLLGSEPRTPDFAACFGWPDAVIPLPYDSQDVAEVLHDLDEQPERLARARAAGVRAALLRHDWAYRWETILRDNGLPPAAGLSQRKADLQEAAAQEADRLPDPRRQRFAPGQR